MLFFWPYGKYAATKLHGELIFARKKMRPHAGRQTFFSREVVEYTSFLRDASPGKNIALEKGGAVRLVGSMDNGVEQRGSATHQATVPSVGQGKPDLYRTIVADSEKPEKKTLRDLSLEWITDVKSGAETAYGVGGFRYRIYTTEEFGTCCMYMWPGHSITTYYESHEEGKLAMNDHYEALCQIREEVTRDLAKENELLRRRLQVMALRAQD